MATSIRIIQDDTTVLEDSGTFYLDDEIGLVLAELWKIRWNLTNEQRDRLLALTKENYFD